MCFRRIRSTVWLQRAGPHAVGRTFDIKHRSYVKALPMLVRDLSWARELAYIPLNRNGSSSSSGRARSPLCCRAATRAVHHVGGGRPLPCALTDHSFVQTLLRHLGYPLAGTSANVSGQEAINDAVAITSSFSMTAPQPDLILDVGILPDSQPSTVVDLSGRNVRILRQGAVRADKILALL